MKSLSKTGKNNLRISGINNVRIYTYDKVKVLCFEANSKGGKRWIKN